MSFEPIPEPSMSSDYLKIKEGEKHRIRIMGTSKDPATFIQGWESWGDDNKPHREPYVLNQPCPKELRDLDRDGKPKLFWMFTVWHVELEKPMVFEVTQSTIKTPILAYANNPAWGDPSQPPPKAVTDAMKDAAIDVRVVFDDGNPFGALVVDDQENIRQLREKGEPIPMGEELSSVGSVARDAVETLKAAQDKQQSLAPEMKDGMPY